MEITITLSDIFLAIWIASGCLAIFAWYQTRPESRPIVKDVFRWRGFEGLVIQTILVAVVLFIGVFWWIPVIQSEMQDG